MNTRTHQKSPALTRGRLAERTGVHPESIRFYESRGILSSPQRSSSGYRQYSEEAVDQLRFIKRAQELGFTLAEIGELLKLRQNRRGPSERVRRLAEEKLAVIDAKIRDLRRMKRVLGSLAGACDGVSPVAECPILAALEKEAL